jgi:hypothetical protein
MTDRKLDQPRIVAELAPHWLAGLAGAEATEGRQLLTELVADWAREADKDADPESINKFQREELKERDAGSRLVVLRGLTAEWQVRRIGARAFALGSAVVDDKIDRDAAVAQGKALLAEVEALAKRVRAIGDATVEARLSRDLNDAMLDALYAVERKAGSLRLGRYAADRAAKP